MRLVLCKGMQSAATSGTDHGPAHPRRTLRPRLPIAQAVATGDDLIAA